MTFEEFEDDYHDLVSEVINAGRERYELCLKDFFHLLDNSPFAASRVRELEGMSDFPTWFAKCKESVGGALGSGKLDWSDERKVRLGQEVSLFRYLSENTGFYVKFSMKFLYESAKYDDMIYKINDQLFEPFAKNLLKDLKRKHNDLIPASDRVVQLDHNSKELSELLSDLSKIEEAVEKNNQLRMDCPEEQERTVAELSAGRRLLKAAQVRVGVLLDLIGGALRWVLDKFAGQAIEPLIQRVLKWVEALYGSWF